MATIEHVIEVNAAPDAVYDCLVRFDAYPSFVQDVRQVRRVGALRLEWQSGHGEQARSWEAEIVQQIPGRRVVLRTMRGPRYEVTAELGSMAAQDGGRGTAVPRTRLRLLIEFDEHEQILPEHGDVVAALRARSEQDLARFKKHVEHHVPAGVHVAALEPARTRPVELDAGAPVGKTIGQTAAEREESMRSQPHWQQPAEPHAGEHAGERHGHGLRRMTPSLPDLWNLWQQPFRMMRSFSRAVHGFEQVFESVRTGGRREETLPKAWTPTVETAQREQKFIICAELPGVSLDDVNVEIKHDRLTIEGDRRPEPQHEPDEQRRSERSYGHFYRVVALPPGAQPEGASASMQDGLLEITVPLSAHPYQTRRIDVRPKQERNA